MSPPRLCWYGDDFTGATDTLAVLTEAGLRAMLFLDVPTPQRQAAATRLLGELDAVGIAGATRSMRPVDIRATLAPVGTYFASLGAPVLHYKVCSTFDSAPDVGSIGAAVEALRPHAANRFVPVVAGQPSLGRYCAFSNLFAAAGQGGAVERIDRHPTMSEHPVTPMYESDLRRHLATQGLEPMAALHYPLYANEPAAIDSALDGLLRAGPAAVVLDVAHEAHLPTVGRLLWSRAQQQPLLAVGPSSVAQALLAHWRGEGADRGPAARAALQPARGPVLVFAGSLSPVTARQVRAASSFEKIAVEPEHLLDVARLRAVSSRVVTALRAGDVLVCTAPPQGARPGTSRGSELAGVVARLLRRVLLGASEAGTRVQRVGIAGGDTSSLAVQALGLWGLSYAATLGAGVTVSRTHSDDPVFDGMELMLKGGQMGADDVFERLLRGNAPG